MPRVKIIEIQYYFSFRFYLFDIILSHAALCIAVYRSCSFLVTYFYRTSYEPIASSDRKYWYKSIITITSPAVIGLRSTASAIVTAGVTSFLGGISPLLVQITQGTYLELDYYHVSWSRGFIIAGFCFRTHTIVLIGCSSQDSCFTSQIAFWRIYLKYLRPAFCLVQSPSSTYGSW